MLLGSFFNLRGSVLPSFPDFGGICGCYAAFVPALTASQIEERPRQTIKSASQIEEASAKRQVPTNAGAKFDDRTAGVGHSYAPEPRVYDASGVKDDGTLPNHPRKPQHDNGTR